MALTGTPYKWIGLPPRNDIRYMSEFQARSKEAAINMYTNGEATCRWCGQGDIDVLTIDHVHNNGGKHLRKYPNCISKVTGYKLYLWLCKHDYPNGYQVLCLNCNLKKELLRRRAIREEKYGI